MGKERKSKPVDEDFVKFLLKTNENEINIVHDYPEPIVLLEKTMYLEKLVINRSILMEMFGLIEKNETLRIMLSEINEK